MDGSLFRTLGEVAGIGGISLGVLLFVFRDVIRKNIFPMLTKQQAYKLLRLALILVWLIGLIGIGAWFAAPQHPNGYTVPKLTKAERENLDIELAEAAFCRDTNRREQALAHYREALKIDKNNPDIIREIQALEGK
jgi:hypothetical protein